MHDHFARLGLPRRFSLDRAALESRYLAHSRAIHPDYHTSGATADLAASLELSAQVNEAYNILRDPFSRAEHLLALEGGPAASEQRQMPPAFLAEMLELREAIEEARLAGTSGSQEVSRLEADLTARYSELFEQIGALFEKLHTDSESIADFSPLLTQIRLLLNAAKYLRGLLRDLTAD